MPGLDSLQSFKVQVKENEVYITASEEQLKNTKRVRPMTKCEGDERVFVVIGGGAAGSAAVESIRANNFKGRLVWISREKTLPVDRIRLSKAFDLDEETAQLRTAEFYSEKVDVEIHLEATVTCLEHDTKTVIYKQAGKVTTLKYDSVLVATGGSPMPLRMEGGRSDNIFTVRTLEDSMRIGEAVKSKNNAKFVVVGSNFIGMECAASLSKLTTEPVIVLSRGELPFKPFGPEIGKALLNFFSKNGVVFKPNSEPKELKTENGKVHTIVCADGTEVACDYVVAGVGVEIKSSTAFIVPIADHPLGENFIDSRSGAITVDKHLRVAPGFFAAGDIVKYPDPLFGEARIEHWAVAGSMGKCAGENMAKEKKDSGDENLTSYSTVPYFWTTNFGKGIRYTGHALSWDEIIFDKEENGFEPDTLKFAAYFVKQDRVLAVATIARDPIVSRSAELMYAKVMPTATQIKAAIKENGTADSLIL